jgi:hypothetical protein
MALMSLAYWRGRVTILLPLALKEARGGEHGSREQTH